MTDKQSSWLTQYITDPAYNLAYGAGDAAKTVTDAARDKETGDFVMRAALGGLGLGLSGSRLYHLLQNVNKPKNTHTKFGPGAKTLDENEKVANALVEALRKAYENASHGIGQAVSSVHPTLRTPAVLGAAGLGLYGGSQLVNSIEDKKRKEEQDELVDDAKKDYQRALMGKKYAAAFDAAFATCTEKKAINPVDVLVRYPLNTLQTLGGETAAALYATGVLGAGALSGKMTYDWTRARSKDKALEKARKSRARIEGAAPLYIDPEQLAAIKKIAD